jgi:sugar phosphate isomerase/epimerase
MRNQIAVQMYTVREFTKSPKDFIRTIKKIQKIGYIAVQLSGIGCMNGDKPLLTAKEAKKILDDHGLACVATHRGWNNYANQIDQEIEFHKQLGCAYTALGSLNDDPFGKKAGAFEHFAELVVPIVNKLNSAGIEFGYHNHASEFEKYEKGKTHFDILIEQCPKKMAFELDLYWLWKGGTNPITMVQKLAGRVPVIHVKDYTVVGNDSQFGAIGEGNLDWPAFIPACHKAGVKWYIVEQDTCPRDPFDCLASSYQYLTEGNFLS